MHSSIPFRAQHGRSSLPASRAGPPAQRGARPLARVAANAAAAPTPPPVATEQLAPQHSAALRAAGDASTSGRQHAQGSGRAAARHLARAPSLTAAAHPPRSRGAAQLTLHIKQAGSWQEVQQLVSGHSHGMNAIHLSAAMSRLAQLGRPQEEAAAAGLCRLLQQVEHLSLQLMAAAQVRAAQPPARTACQQQGAAARAARTRPAAPASAPPSAVPRPPPRMPTTLRRAPPSPALPTAGLHQSRCRRCLAVPKQCGAAGA
jgi:hypothetical protein